MSLDNGKTVAWFKHVESVSLVAPPTRMVLLQFAIPDVEDLEPDIIFPVDTQQFMQDHDPLEHPVKHIYPIVGIQSSVVSRYHTEIDDDTCGSCRNRVPVSLDDLEAEGYTLVAHRTENNVLVIGPVGVLTTDDEIRCRYEFCEQQIVVCPWPEAEDEEQFKPMFDYLRNMVMTDWFECFPEDDDSDFDEDRPSTNGDNFDSNYLNN